MIVTINTDASWSPRQKVASFAFWIRSDSGKIARSGMLKGEIPNPDVAEFKCILNALFALFNSEWNGIGKIIVNTDSLNSIRVFMQDHKHIKRYGIGKWRIALYSEYLRLKKDFKHEIEFRHVKAHESTSTKRQWVNDWCDKEAKQQLIKWHQKNNSIKK